MTLVGRDTTVRQTSDCHECCSTDLCNDNVCHHQKPSACVDDPTVDCAVLETVNICEDVLKAKRICAKFCNLCALVDGDWSDWSSWSKLTITCGNGTVIRTRTCSEPAPANGGLDCIGESSHTQERSLELCPVHGGWSQWSEWGHCSASCDVGMQQRDRNCSNPYPSSNGNHCFGESLNYRLCKPGACADNSVNLLPEAVVAFRATTVTDKTPSENQTYIFRQASLNEGSAYNTHTGIFTAPKSGLYLFDVHMCSYNNHSAHYAIVRDGFQIAAGKQKDNQNFACGTVNALMRLTTGNRVWVMPTSTHNYLVDEKGFICSFEGVRLHQ